MKSEKTHTHENSVMCMLELQPINAKEGSAAACLLVKLHPVISSNTRYNVQCLLQIKGGNTVPTMLGGKGLTRLHQSVPGMSGTMFRYNVQLQIVMFSGADERR